VCSFLYVWFSHCQNLLTRHAARTGDLICFLDEDCETCPGDCGSCDDNTSCFSSHATVEVWGHGTVRMDALKIGDFVLTGNGAYEQIYSFGHYAPKAPTRFIQIQSDQHTPLEVTSDHLLYTLDLASNITSLRPASEVNAGDRMVTSEHNYFSTVKSIRTIVRRGAFAPFTASGQIVVNGVVSSNYIALPPPFQRHASYELQHWIQHAAYAPYRAYCFAFDCREEAYDAVTGFSRAVTLLVPLLKFLEPHVFKLASFAASLRSWIVHLLLGLITVASIRLCFRNKRQNRNKETKI